MTDDYPNVDTDPNVQALLAAIKRDMAKLEELRADCDKYGEDGVYRFYHQSCKVYERLQRLTDNQVKMFRELLPGRELNASFMEIVQAGTGRRFESNTNEHWLEHTRPIVEAFFHARYFLEMACKYGKALDEPPLCMPSGWAAVLYLYDLR